MNILKPQNICNKELVNKNLISIRENEEISDCIFENQECDNSSLYEVEFDWRF